MDSYSNFQVVKQTLTFNVNCLHFKAFFGFRQLEGFVRKFCIYNITLPGQETNSQTLPSSYIYPNIDQLVSLLLSVTEHYNILTMLGLGVGLGANILLRFALKHQQMVEGLVLINCSAQRQGRIGYSSLAMSRSCAGWAEWAFHKRTMLVLWDVHNMISFISL